jgi:hypothetical protein
VKRALSIDEGQDAVDQLLTFEIADFAERELAAEMIVAVRVAAGTAQRTLACDFDGKCRYIANENSTPGWNNPFHPTNISAVC